MDKKYQIFVSSTYTDLKDERAAVTEAIVKKKHIPIAMEFFSASNLSQLEYIKKLLDFVDYYVLIVGGRYGSIDEETGKSYTELEFEYAIEKKIPIITFYPKYPNKITQDKLDNDPELKSKLDDFIKLAMKDRMACSYEDPGDLKYNFMISLDELISDFPRIGWIRADEANNGYLLEELKGLKESNKELQKINEDLEKKIIRVQHDDIVNYDEDITIYCKIEVFRLDGYRERDLSQMINLRLSSFLCDYGYKLMSGFVDDDFYEYISDYLFDNVYTLFIGEEFRSNMYKYVIEISERDKYSILYHMQFLNLLFKTNNDVYYLTEAGKTVVEESIVYRKFPF